MKKSPNLLIYAFAIIGLGAVIFGGWALYEKEATHQETQRAFSEPVPSGLPNIFRNASPPPQPHP